MAHGEISEFLPHTSAEVFDLLHDYDRRLEWDTLLTAAYLEGENVVAGKGVVSVCVGRATLGGIAIRAIYVSFQSAAKLAAVKMLNSPPFFSNGPPPFITRTFLPTNQTDHYKFQFTAKPHFLRLILEPIMQKVFVGRPKTPAACEPI